MRAAVLVLLSCAVIASVFCVDQIELLRDDGEPKDLLGEIVDEQGDDQQHLMALAIAPLTRGDLVQDCDGKLELKGARNFTLGKETYPNLKKR